MANPPLADAAAFAREHVGYEASMFAEARDALYGGMQQGFESNLLIEACVLHFRNLVDFFYPSASQQADDVTAVDYISTWGSPSLPAPLKDARDRANKEL